MEKRMKYTLVFRQPRQKVDRALPFTNEEELNAFIEKHEHLLAWYNVENTKNFIYFEPNEGGRHKNDCVIRALTKYTGVEYGRIYKTLLRRYPNSTYKRYNNVIKECKRIGLVPYYLRHDIDIREIAENLKHTKALVLQHGHLVAIEKGNIYDNGTQALGLKNEVIMLKPQHANEWLEKVARI